MKSPCGGRALPPEASIGCKYISFGVSAVSNVCICGVVGGFCGRMGRQKALAWRECLRKSLRPYVFIGILRQPAAEKKNPEPHCRFGVVSWGFQSPAKGCVACTRPSCGGCCSRPTGTSSGSGRDRSSCRTACLRGSGRGTSPSYSGSVRCRRPCRA